MTVRVLTVGNIYPPHDLRGGYELTWQASVRDLRNRGHLVRVLTTDLAVPGVREPDDPDVHRELRWYWRDYAFPRMRVRERLALERHNAAVLECHLSELQPDVVCWWGMGGMSLGLVEQVRRRGLPAVGVVGDEWMVWGPRVDAWFRLFAGRPRAGAVAARVTGLPTRVELGSAAHWIFNSEATRRRSVAAGWGLERTDVAHPGIDQTLFRFREPGEWAWRLLYLGRMDERKGVHVAIEALALLPERATLLLQGSGEAPYLDRLRRQAERLGVSERIRFLEEPRSELGAVYAAADAVLFPVQWEEPWGLVPLEAMAVGRPVVASGTGGSSEYLRHEENCLLYRPRESAAALAAEITRLSEDAELRDRVRAGGRRTAAQYDEAAYSDAIAAAIETAAGARLERVGGAA